ncbi:MAG: flagellar basal body rod modification protein [Bacteroidetes bacterium ADurb.Bin174]|nr:MAG: flagellar basal body rod modification protein [Bacteroidetes bacterium ADurb.Bin174]
MIILLGIIISVLSIAQIYACAMTAVVCQSSYTLQSGMVDFGDGSTGGGESNWLYNMSNINNDGHGMVYYHREGYGGHGYKVLQNNNSIDTFPYGSNNHLYRHSGQLSSAPYSSYYNNFVSAAKSKQGKIFLGHVRKRSDGPWGAFAPFVYRHIGYVNGVPDTTDYSFVHHGTVDKNSMYDIQSFQNWLSDYDIQNALNGHPTYYSIEDSLDIYVDSDYLFLWLVKFIEENDGDVRSGLVEGLTALKNNNINGQVNIIFSDGTGVYAYSNHNDTAHRMSYKSQQTIYHYVRSYTTVPPGWNSLELHHLYYFPTQGQMDITYNADESVPASFALKQGLNWIGFPVLEGTYGLDPDYTLRDVNPYVNKMQTKNGTILEDPWVYSDETNSWPSDAVLSRTNGYILNIDSTYVNYQYRTFGQRTPYSTALTLYQNNENWVPYFVQPSHEPAFAFGGNFSHVTAIYAQDWYIYKFKGQWYGYIQPGATGTLDYGKMYKVYVDSTITNFTWSAFGQSQSFAKEATEYFEYEEQPEYQAIVIESIPDSPIFDEIGVLKDGLCVGALKFSGYPINLQVYDNSSPDEFEYVLYSASKNNGYQEKKYTSALLDVSCRVVENGKYKFSIVGLDGGQERESVVSSALSAMIYPNPMRSNTIIEINASAKSVVEISIYNLKGQLVKTISSTEISKGNTSFIWNGKTDDGRQVAQGLYFCRIKSPNNLLTKKLIVLE